MAYAYADLQTPGAEFLIQQGLQPLKPNPQGTGQTPIWEYPNEWTLGTFNHVVYFAPFRGANIWGTYAGSSNYRGGTFELCCWPISGGEGWDYYGVTKLAITPNYAGVCPTGDVLRPGKSLHQLATHGDRITFEFQNPGQVADSRARYRIVTVEAPGYEWLRRCHNILHHLNIYNSRKTIQ